MTEVFLIRYGEIALKGKNRINFENKLIDNVERATGIRPKRTSGRLLLYPNKKNMKDIQKTSALLRKVFGITSISLAKVIDLDIEKIEKEVLRQAKTKRYNTFRITVQRTQKRLKPSPELEKEIGAFMVEKTGKKVRLKGADLEIFIEISENACIFTEKIRCFGGLPLGIEGNVALFIEGKNKKDNEKSILAGLLMMKRGCDVYPFALKKTNINILGGYGSKKLAILKNMDEMEKEARKKGCKAVVLGQTLDDLSEIKTGLAVLRPIISYGQGEINEKLKGFRDNG